MSRPPKVDELTSARRDELRAAVREIDHRLRDYPEPNPRNTIEEAWRSVDGHPDKFRAWVDGYVAGLTERVPDLVADTIKSIERIRDGLL